MTTPRYRYGIIGTGRPHGSPGATGFGMAYPHMHGFQATGRVDLVAIADIREDNARLFLEKHESNARFYTDYHEMLAKEDLDLVSVCTWPHLHAEMAISAAEANVKGILCEKPMALTWGDAKRMKAAADANSVLLTFDHQRRFLEPFQTARRLADEGAIGDLVRLEAMCGDLSDWGSHWLDMLFFFNGDRPAVWVIGQIDSRVERKVFGASTENQAISHFKFENDVRGLLVTGFEADIGCALRMIGAEGVIEIHWSFPFLRVRGKGDSEMRSIETKEGLHDHIAWDRACADLVRALDEPGHKPLLSADNAIRSTEITFATYESSRRRGRIDLPLQTEDSALLAMLADGSIGPR